MTIILTDKVYIPERALRRCCKTQRIVEILSESSSPEALIVLEKGEYKNMVSARNALNQAIRSMHRDSLFGAKIRKEEDQEMLYIIRKLI